MVVITTRKKENKRIIEQHVAHSSNIIIELSLKAIELFINAKQVEGIKERTIYDYNRHFNWFTRYLNEYHPNVTTIQAFNSRCDTKLYKLYET
jgi:integrase/recombinase XerD